MACLAVTQVHDFVAGGLDADELASVDEHLDGCVSCRELVAGVSRALADSPAAAAREQLLLPAGAQIGRFEIEEVLGRGAMGVVYAARDPRLGRRVALKLLRADRPDETTGDRRASLIGEAQAMAQLAHPNVVAIYDAGPVEEGDDEGEGELYVAMELVSGVTLREELEQKRQRRSWRQVVELLLAAGRGLEAAHRAGVCHRDFKPENVIIGGDGRPRVSDFGLARAAPAAQGGGAEDSLHTQTAAGGTPIYMAPELFAGAAASPASDQFSFCVTLFEALYGRRPFAGDGLEELVRNARGGNIAWPAGARVPGRVRRALLRGLNPDPQRRFPDMGALLAALARALGQRRRIAGVALATAAAAGIAAAITASAIAAEPERPCEATAQRLEEVWNEARRQALSRVFAGAGAKDAFRVTARAIEARAGAWAEMRVDSCRATYVRREQSEALFDLRALCLDRRLSELDAVLELLATAEKKALIDAPLLVAELRGVSACADKEALRAAVPPPEDPGAAKRVAALQGELDKAEARSEAGDAEKARELAEPLVGQARELGYDPLVAEALQVLAGAHLRLGDLEEAEAILDEALEIASRARDHPRVANILTTMVYLVGAHQQKLTAALALARPAEAAVAQAGNDPLLRADLHMNLGGVYDLAGKREEAEVELKKALALYREHRESESPRVGDVLHNLGALAMERGDRQRARERFEEALELRAELLGESHPAVANTSLGLGAVARRDQRLGDARRHYERAAEIFRATYGKGHARLGAVHNNLAIVSLEEEDLEDAERHHRAALKIRRKAYGKDHPLVAQSLGGLGNVMSEIGRHEEARELYEQSLAMRRKVYPEGHPGVAIGLHALAGALGARGDHGRAVELRGEALEILEAVEIDPVDMAEVRFAQARDLDALGPGRRGEATALAEKARAAYAAGGEATAERLEEVRRWLERRGE